jgi:hypothetical protein
MGKMGEIYQEITTSPEYLKATEPKRLEMLDNWQQYYEFKNTKNGIKRLRREPAKSRR